MATLQKFEDMEIWQTARAIALDIFNISQKAPLCKDFELKNQMNASAGSVMDNIAEGFGRGSRLEFIQFLSIASGSADELKSQLYRCRDRNYIKQEEFDKLYDRINNNSKQINGFIKYLNTTLVKGMKFKDRVVNNKKL